MRVVKTADITEAVRRLCIEANLSLSDDVRAAAAAVKEGSTGAARAAMEDIEENLKAAAENKLPICQDTGMAVCFIKQGCGVSFDGSLEDAVNEGVRRGYKEGYLRKSVVKDPLFRENTGDNTPAVIHIEPASGDVFEITVAPKGFGSENMSAIKMFNPTASEDDVVAFVKETVSKAGSKPCPPLIIGVGVGGTFEKAALLAKKALLLPCGGENPDPRYAALEKKMKDAVNATGIGPMGYGGGDTCMSVRVLYYPTHIAGLPVAVNISCHVTRHKTAVL